MEKKSQSDLVLVHVHQFFHLQCPLGKLMLDVTSDGGRRINPTKVLSRFNGDGRANGEYKGGRVGGATMSHVSTVSSTGETAFLLFKSFLRTFSNSTEVFFFQRSTLF